MHSASRPRKGAADFAAGHPVHLQLGGGSPVIRRAGVECRGNSGICRSASAGAVGNSFPRLGSGRPRHSQRRRGLYLRPRDLGKLGQLVLQRGRSGSSEVVPARWIAESTRRLGGTIDQLGALGGSAMGISGGWAVAGGNDGVLGRGYGGQLVYIVPGLDLAVVTTARWQDSVARSYQLRIPASSRKAATGTKEVKLGACLNTRAASRKASGTRCPVRRRYCRWASPSS